MNQRKRQTSRAGLSFEQLECRRVFATLPVVSGDEFELGIDDSDTFAVLQMPADAYQRFVQRSSLEQVSETIYDSFDDQFDFLIFVLNEEEPSSNEFGRAENARNDTLGLSYGLFDASDEFGSSGRLQTAIQLSTLSGLRGGPSLHEIIHRWANRFDEFGFSNHWDFSNVGGQLGGWQAGTLRLREDGLYEADGPGGRDRFGTIANGGNSIPYSEFELYVMGLIEAEELSQPLEIARNARYVDSATGVFEATAIETITIEQLIADNGRRSPGPDTSQRSFRALTILVTPESVSEQVSSQLALDIQGFSKAGDNESPLFNFWEATGGRAEIRMDGVFHALTRSVPWQNPINQPDVNRDGQVSASDALAVINELNRRGGRTTLGDEPEDYEGLLYDVTGDGQISALDALSVINFLNRQDADSASAIEPEEIDQKLDLDETFRWIGLGNNLF